MMRAPGPKPPPVLYKYLGADRLGFFEHRKLRFTPPSTFNDPYDCRSTARATIEESVTFPSVSIKVPLGLLWPAKTSLQISKPPSQIDGEWPAPNYPVPALWEPLAKSNERSHEIGSIGEMDETPADLAPEALSVKPSQEEQIAALEPAGIKVTPGYSDVDFRVHGGFGKQDELSQLGILSLSARKDSMLMWSHYANAHRGFVVGLATDHPFLARRDPRTIRMTSTKAWFGRPMGDDIQVPPLCKVMYINQHVSMLMTDPRQIIGANSEIFDYAELLFKAKAWEYEEEWRAFRKLTPRGLGRALRLRSDDVTNGFSGETTSFVDAAGQPVVLFEVPKDAIIEIALGINMSVDHRRAVAKALVEDAELAHVKLSVARTDHKFGVAFDVMTAANLLHSLDRPVYLADERLRSDLREALRQYTISQLKHIERRVGLNSVFYSPIPTEVLRGAIHEALAVKRARRKRRAKASSHLGDR